MTSAQINNLIELSFLFHPQLDCNWTKQSPSYIKEKWTNYIGVNVEHVDDTGFLTLKTQNWLKTWQVSDKDWKALKRVIRYIDSLSYKPLLKVPNNNIWTLSELVDNFEIQIGPVNTISNVRYSNLHAILKSEINKWITIKENNRDYKLYTLLS
jgi:hypothetical protein